MRPSTRFVCSIALAGGLLATAGCHQPAAEETPTAAVVELHPNEFSTAHPEQFPLAMIVARPRAETLQVNATIAAEASRTVPVTSQVAGVLVETRAQLGDAVHAGQVLAVVRSADLQQAYSDLRSAEADRRLAAAQLARLQDLLGHGAAAQQEVDVARAAATDADERVRAGRQKLQLWGADPAAPRTAAGARDEVSIVAPRGGIIIGQNTAGGALVPTPDAAQPLFTIADLSQVWVLCDVYENDLGQVAVGEEAEVAVASFPSVPFHGRVSNISGVLDPATRSAQVRVVLDNPQGRLRPGMYGTARLRSLTSHTALLVPQAAVVRGENQSFVFVSLGGGRFRQVAVRAGSVENDAGVGWMPVSGEGGGDAIGAGQRVVAHALDFANALEDGNGGGGGA